MFTYVRYQLVASYLVTMVVVVVVSVIILFVALSEKPIQRCKLIITNRLSLSLSLHSSIKALSHILQNMISRLHTYTSVTRWPDYMFSILPFSTLKICPKVFKKIQSWISILPKTIRNLKILDKSFLKFRQRRKFLPDLVTLTNTNIDYLSPSFTQKSSFLHHLSLFLSFSLFLFIEMYESIMNASNIGHNLRYAVYNNDDVHCCRLNG